MQKKTMTINEEQVQEIMRIAGIPGVSIAYLNSEGEITPKQLGYTDKSKTTKVGADMVCLAASLSKPLFAAVCLKLEASGRFDLKMSLNEILPFEQFCEENNYKRENSDLDKERVSLLTGNMALSHLTGLPIGYNKEGADPLKFKFEPGTEFGYSGIPYDYLQKAIEKHTNSTLESLARELIFDDLGMNNSSFYPSYELSSISDGTRAKGKIFLGETNEGLQIEVIDLKDNLKKYTIPWNELPQNFPRTSSEVIESKDQLRRQYLSTLLDHTSKAGLTPPANSANSLRTTASDYALFVRAMMNDKVLRAAFIPTPGSSMTNDDLAIKTGVPDNVRAKISWGSGWALQTSDGKTRAYHTGDMNEARAIVAMNLDDNTAIVYFANSRNGHILADQIISPNVDIAEGLEAFFQEYGFAREIVNGFEIGLSSENPPEKGKIHLSSTEEALQFEFIGLEKREAQKITLPWDKLPDGIPRSVTEIIYSKNEFIPTLLLKPPGLKKLADLLDHAVT